MKNKQLWLSILIGIMMFAPLTLAIILCHLVDSDLALIAFGSFVSIPCGVILIDKIYK